MKDIRQKLKDGYVRLSTLISCTPPVILALFVASLVTMNLLANKSIDFGTEYLALDCGTIVSWVAFLAMDVFTKHFGPKAATALSIFALALNLLFCLLFFAASRIPGVWSESYVEGSEEVINGALDSTFGGDWYVVLGSALAFIVSAAVNNFSNFGVGKLFKDPDGTAAFFVRSYVSTAIGQFVDNIVFAFVVSRVFFDWTVAQCFICSLTTMTAELILEAAFSPLGLRLCRSWKRRSVGAAYFELSAPKESA